MKGCFADTFYYLALLNSRDAQHEAARRLTADLGAKVTTSDWILTELADALAGSRKRASFADLVRDLRSDPDIEVVPCTRSTLDRAIDLYHARSDKAWSLTDCTSFVIMQDRGLIDALTGDHHFEQAGFHALLK